MYPLFSETSMLVYRFSELLLKASFVPPPSASEKSSPSHFPWALIAPASLVDPVLLDALATPKASQSVIPRHKRNVPNFHANLGAYKTSMSRLCKCPWLMHDFEEKSSWSPIKLIGHFWCSIEMEFHTSESASEVVWLSWMVLLPKSCKNRQNH